jgi:hypothetical protein
MWWEKIQAVIEFILTPAFTKLYTRKMKENVRMWRERIQVVVEYFDSRLHQIVQSTERRKVVECGEKEFRSSSIILTSAFTKLFRWQMKENGSMWRERNLVLVEYFDSRLHQMVQYEEKW